MLISMGRTLPSATQVVLGQIAELEPFYLALCRSDQLILDKFFEAILNHRPAIAHATRLLPMEFSPFAIILEERKRFDQVHNEIIRQIDELEKKLSQLGEGSSTSE